MVLGYADDGGIEETYMPNPEIVKNATKPIDNKELKNYYLQSLPDTSPILEEIMSKLGITDKDIAIQAILD
jgi:hypothetical protein